MYTQSAYPPYGSNPGYASAPPIPMQAPYAYPQPSRWTTGLCGCTDDCSNCCMTFWCPCVTFGRVAEIADEGRTTCCTHATIYTLLAIIGLPCLYSCFYRTKLRARFSLPKEPCGDCCVHCCCELCALCQEHRELKHRGLNPAAGWVGPPMVPPPMAQGMYK